MIKGQEITAEMVEHPCSALFQQAENRLHSQKALMLGIWNGLRHYAPYSNAHHSLESLNEEVLQTLEIQKGI